MLEDPNFGEFFFMMLKFTSKIVKNLSKSVFLVATSNLNSVYAIFRISLKNFLENSKNFWKKCQIYTKSAWVEARELKF
jgi:hypothetical protein